MANFDNWETYKSFAESASLAGNLDESEVAWLLALDEAADLESPLRGCICLEGLADCLSSQQRFEEAERHYSDCVDIRTEFLGRRHPEVGRSLNNLAVCLGAQGKYQRAIGSHTDALSVLMSSNQVSKSEVDWTVKRLIAICNRVGVAFEIPAQITEHQRAESVDEETWNRSICISCNRDYIGHQCLSCTQTQLGAVQIEGREFSYLPVLCARKDIRADTLITFGAVERTRRLAQPEFFYAEVDEAINKVATRLISAGEPIKITDLVSDVSKPFSGFSSYTQIRESQQRK